MSADREQDHLDNMTDMTGSRHWNHSSVYAETPEQEAEYEELLRARLQAAHSQIYVSATAQIREGRDGR